MGRRKVGNAASISKKHRLRLGVYDRGTAYRKEADYEGTSFGQENVRQVQDHPAPRQGARHLREPPPQAAPGL